MTEYYHNHHYPHHHHHHHHHHTNKLVNTKYPTVFIYIPLYSFIFLLYSFVFHRVSSQKQIQELERRDEEMKRMGITGKNHDRKIVGDKITIKKETRGN